MMSTKVNHPYSLQCFVDWIKNIELYDKIIELDFIEIENDLQTLVIKDKDKCKALFYPNIESYYSYKSIQDFDRDREEIKTHYQTLFGGSSSIVHYILYNKSFLFQSNESDISKLNDIKKCMKQSIYILRLLLFKYNIINVTDIFEFEDDDNSFEEYIVSIEEYLRERIIRNIFLFKDIQKLYIDLIIDIHSISDNILQRGVINILHSQDRTRLFHVNFFEHIDIKNGRTAIMSTNIIKQLLFRTVSPVNIIVFKKSIYDELDVQINNFKVEDKLYFLCNEITKIDWTVSNVEANEEYYSQSIIKLQAVTAPLIVCDLAVMAKQEMYSLLNKYLLKVITNDGIHCILDLLYVNCHKLYPKNIENNIMIQAGKFLNYICEINMTKSEIVLFCRKYVTKSMAKYLFVEINDNVQKQLMRDIFCVSDMNVLGVLYELTKLQKLKKDILKAFIECCVLIIGIGTTDTILMELFINIIAIHVLDAHKLNDKCFMKRYIRGTAKELDRVYDAAYDVQRQFIDDWLSKH